MLMYKPPHYLLTFTFSLSADGFSFLLPGTNISYARVLSGTLVL